ncbi:MAG: hypothetical protein JWO02_2352, partial [Solirubrobacterales bacterium]|nr:hypothetical protein [Solirubrobacterales bacterium]
GGGVEAAREQAMRPRTAAAAVPHPVGQAAARAGVTAGVLQTVVRLPRSVFAPGKHPAKGRRVITGAKPQAAQAVTVADPSTTIGLPVVVTAVADGGVEAPLEEVPVVEGTLPTTDGTHPTAPADDPAAGAAGAPSTGEAPAGGTVSGPTATGTTQAPASGSTVTAQAAQTTPASGRGSGGAPAPAEGSPPARGPGPR